MLRTFFLSVFVWGLVFVCKAQTDSTGYNPEWDYQIYLTKPAKEIRELLNDKTCEPVNGRISGDGKTIVMKNYPGKTRIYVKVIYTDNTEDEFVRSSCFI